MGKARLAKMYWKWKNLTFITLWAYSMDIEHDNFLLCSSLGGSTRRLFDCMVIRRLRVQSPPGTATYFRRDWPWNIFYSHSLPFVYSHQCFRSVDCPLFLRVQNKRALNQTITNAAWSRFIFHLSLAFAYPQSQESHSANHLLFVEKPASLPVSQ